MTGPKFSGQRIPGMGASTTSSANKQYYFGGSENDLSRYELPFTLASDAVDAGNSGLTTTIRGGTILMQRSTGILVPYGQSGETGNIIGILPRNTSTLLNGTAANRLVGVVTGGMLRASEIPNLDYQAAAHLVARGFTFDNPVYNRAYGVMNDVSVTDTTVATAANHGTRWFCASASDEVIVLPEIWNASGNITSTLGLEFEVTQTSTGGVSFITVNYASYPSFMTVGGFGEAQVTTNGFGQTLRVVCRKVLTVHRYVLDGIGYI